MKHYRLFHTIMLSFILTGCGGSSGSSPVAELDAGSGDTDSGDTDSGDTDSGDTDSGDASSGDASSGDASSGDTGSGDTDSDGSGQDAVEPEVTNTTYTFSRVYGGQALTINATITEFHKDDPNLTKYRVWDYRNPAVIGNDSSAQKVYFYDQYSDPDEVAYGQENHEGFEKSSSIEKVTYTYSDLSLVRSNQFLKITSEQVTPEKTELTGIYHDKIHSQTFSDSNSSMLIAEELLHIVEEVNYREPCDDDHVSVGELGRYISQGYWQIGDKLTIDLDIHSPAFQCIEGIPEYLGHVRLTSTSTSELLGPLSQVTLQGRRFNSVLHFATSAKVVSQDTGNAISEDSGSAYHQLHTGFVASEETECLIGSNGKRYCSEENKVASNLPTIPVIN